MLIICNGAFKSGSTWLFMLLKCGINPLDIPESFRITEKWNGETIQETDLPRFLATVDIIRHDYVIKTHWDKASTLKTALAHPDVYVFNIVRDFRDVIVSAYYHYHREFKRTESFEEFYWKERRDLLAYLQSFHRLWRKRPGKVHVASYEGLLRDFAAEIRKVFAFIGRPIEDKHIDILARHITMDSLRAMWKESDKPAEERFFRQGKSGDWKRHFTPEMEADFHTMNRSMALHFRMCDEMNPIQWGQRFPIQRDFTVYTPGKAMREDWVFQDLFGRLGLPAGYFRGKRVLDIHTGSGAAAFYMEAQGAQVTAVDTCTSHRRGFAVVQNLRRSACRYVRASVYDLDPQRMGTFDFVFFWDDLHLCRDPLLAMERIRSVCAPGAMLVTRRIDVNSLPPRETAQDGLSGQDGSAAQERREIFLPNRYSLKQWLSQQGFSFKIDVQQLPAMTEEREDDWSTLPHWVFLAEYAPAAAAGTPAAAGH